MTTAESRSSVYDRPSMRRGDEGEGVDFVARASAVGGSCRRELAYLLADAEPTDEVEESTQLLFETGRALESVVLDSMERSGWDIERIDADDPTPAAVTLVDGRMLVEGYPDAFGTIGVFDDLPKVIEVKTRSAGAFKRWTQVGTVRSHPEAAAQAAVYSLGIFGEYRPVAIATMNTDERRWDTEVLRAHSLEAALVRTDDRMREFVRTVDAGETPAPDFEKDYWKCGGCVFRTLCSETREDAVEEPGVETAEKTVTQEEFQQAMLAYERAHEAGKPKKNAQDILRRYMVENNLELMEVEGAKKTRKVKLAGGGARISVNQKKLRLLLSDEAYAEVVTESPTAPSLRVT